MDHKETSSQLKLIKNNYVTILHQPVTVSWNTCSQMHVCTNRAFSSKSMRFNHYIGWCYCSYILYQSKWLPKVDVLENALFVHAFGYTCFSQQLQTGALQLHSYFYLVRADYLFPCFVLQSLLTSVLSNSIFI